MPQIEMLPKAEEEELTTEDTEFHGGGKMLGCPQDSNPPCTPWLFIPFLLPLSQKLRVLRGFFFSLSFR